MVSSTKVTPDENPKYHVDQGKETLDKLFILSIVEAKKYFPSDESRVCFPTKFAVYRSKQFKKLYTDQMLVFGGSCFWSLRSAGYSQSWCTLVCENGEINNVGVGSAYSDDEDKYAVRPAMWIDF